MATSVPVFLLCGFLGAGKTTFIHQTLSATSRGRGTSSGSPLPSASEGVSLQLLQRPLLIVNDFNDFNVDALTLGTADDPSQSSTVRSIAGGCICCTKLEEFVDVFLSALSSSQEQRQRQSADRIDGEDSSRVGSSSMGAGFDHVIVETTGLADPTPILMALSFHPKLRSHCSNLTTAPPQGEKKATTATEPITRQFHIESAVTFIDPTQFHQHPLMVDQLRHVNCVVVSKFDLLKSMPDPTSTLATVVRAIRDVNPSADVYPAVNGALGPVLSRGASEAELGESSVGDSPLSNFMNRFDQHGTLQLLQNLKAAGWVDDGISEADKYGYHTFLYHASTPFDEVKLVKALSDGSLLHGVTRSKGYFKLRVKAEAVEAIDEAGPPNDLIHQWNSCGRRFFYGQVLPRHPSVIMGKDDGNQLAFQSLEEAVGGCKIVFIGRQMVQADIVRILDSCCVDGE